MKQQGSSPAHVLQEHLVCIGNPRHQGSHKAQQTANSGPRIAFDPSAYSDPASLHKRLAEKLSEHPLRFPASREAAVNTYSRASQHNTALQPCRRPVVAVHSESRRRPRLPYRKSQAREHGEQHQQPIRIKGARKRVSASGSGYGTHPPAASRENAKNADSSGTAPPETDPPQTDPPVRAVPRRPLGASGDRPKLAPVKAAIRRQSSSSTTGSSVSVRRSSSSVESGVRVRRSSGSLSRKDPTMEEARQGIESLRDQILAFRGRLGRSVSEASESMPDSCQDDLGTSFLDSRDSSGKGALEEKETKAAAKSASEGAELRKKQLKNEEMRKTKDYSNQWSSPLKSKERQRAEIYALNVLLAASEAAQADIFRREMEAKQASMGPEAFFRMLDLGSPGSGPHSDADSGDDGRGSPKRSISPVKSRPRANQFFDSMVHAV